MEKSRSEIAYLINEWVFNKRDREIMCDRMLDGMTYDELSSKFCLSPQRLKVIVRVNKNKILSHI